MTPAQTIIEQTKQLIAIRSTADRPEDLRRAVNFVEKIVAAHKGITIERFERGGKLSFLAYRKGPRPEKFDILLNGHVDVVPGKPKLFKPYEKDGKLYGRGALDMKGTALTLTNVFCEMVNSVPYSLALQIVSDEEIGGYDGVRMQIDEYGVRADFVIMGEYANDRNTIYNAARGLCWAEIAFKGREAHGGHLWNGDNAVLKAGSFAAELLKRYPTPDRETWTTTASIASLATPNQTFNKVPDKAVLKVDFRFTQEDPVFQSRENLEAMIAELDPEAELINLAVFEPAVNVATLNPYVQSLSGALHKVTGKPVKYLGRPAGSDGRHFALVGNDTVEFGLYGQNPHADDEYVELTSFEEYRATLRAFLQKPLLANDSQQKQIHELSAKLLRGKDSAKIWYVSYGSGLSMESFRCQIRGGKPAGLKHAYKGCTDRTLPRRSEFVSLPYALSFSGKCPMCDGGHVYITKTPTKGGNAIARAHLITAEQFAELIAEQSGQKTPSDLPFEAAMEYGYAPIEGATDSYNTLVFCGLKDEMPMFAVTAKETFGPYLPPSPGYINMLCAGLSENQELSAESAAQYLLSTPGVEEKYHKPDILSIFNKTTHPRLINTDLQSLQLPLLLRGEPERIIQATASPKILLTWLHADEALASLVAHHIYTKRPDLAKHVDYICGNPKAAASLERVGFIETDLNRSFGVAQPQSYEEKRAAMLLKLVKKYDYVLDLHTTVNPEFGSCIFIDGDKLEESVVRAMLAASSESRFINMPKTTSQKSLILVARNAITIECSETSAASKGVPEIIKLLENLLGLSRHRPKERTIYHVEGTVPKTEDPGPKARNFELYKPGGYYPILLNDGPRSYREDPTKDYCCFYAKRVEKIVL